MAPAKRYRFGVFEVDAATGELRRQGVRIKLHTQPFQVLAMMLERPGELLTREEICNELWPEGTFVDYEHGLNSTVNRIREALGDKASSPRFIETLARRGYRFLAPVERLGVEQQVAAVTLPTPPEAAAVSIPDSRLHGFLATPDDLPESSHTVVQTLFLLLQFMYLAFYIGALANLAEISEILSVLPHATRWFELLVMTASVLVPLRAFLFCAVLFRAPRLRQKFLRIWPLLLFVDVLWSLSPFLLIHHINAGLALACTTLLVYSPFAQRALVLMGAGDRSREAVAAQ